MTTYPTITYGELSTDYYFTKSFTSHGITITDQTITLKMTLCLESKESVDIDVDAPIYDALKTTA